MNHLDKDGDGTISIAEFMDVVWQRKLKLLRQKFQAASYSIGGIDLDKLFRHYDRDNSGELDFEEFRQAVRKDVKMKSSDVTDVELREVFDHVDSDKGGTIGLSEFKSLMGIETGGEDHSRHDSMSGQVFLKILVHAEEKRANVLNLFHQFDVDNSGGTCKCNPPLLVSPGTFLIDVFAGVYRAGARRVYRGDDIVGSGSVGGGGAAGVR
jgi:hypothetical protein